MAAFILNSKFTVLIVWSRYMYEVHNLIIKKFKDSWNISHSAMYIYQRSNSLCQATN